MLLYPSHWLWRLWRWIRDVVSTYVNIEPLETVIDSRRLKYNFNLPEIKFLKIDNNLVTVSESSYYEEVLCHTT